MIFDNPLEEQRLEKAEQLKALGKNPYAHNIVKDSDTAQFAKDYAYVKELEDHRDESKESTLTGRVKFVRLMGKAAFAKIEDTHGMLQIYFARDRIGEEWFKAFRKLLDVGDIVLVKGFPFVTKTGELSLNATRIEIVTKSLTPLPEKFHGLQDQELKYRQRYLDMIMDAEVKKRFMVRSKVVSTIRNFFEDKGFLEVETPMMHPIAGGANARPFVTRHNALGVDRFLRIAPELYLKRLIVGGFDAVFEINRNFRNEGMDHTHNPEFTMIEFYWAYHNYEDLMNLTEELFHVLLERLDLPQILSYGEHEIDYRKFARVKYLDALVDIGGVPADIIEDADKIRAYLADKDVHVKEGLSLGYLQAELFDEFVEEKLINPTFITQFPIDISPLARRNEEESHIADRFELFIAGKEIGNGFNELNDPIDQYNRFKGQIDAKDAGDDEAHEMDEDYVRALGYGMSPTAGEGIGIDRLVMLLTNAHTIRDVIIFPAMKPILKQENNETQGDK